MTQLSADGSSTTWTVSSQRLIEALTERAEALVGDSQQTIMAGPKFSDFAWVPPSVSEQKTCTANVRSIAGAMAAFGAIAGLSEHLDQLREARRVIRDALFCNQLPVVIDDGDIVMGFGPVDTAEQLHAGVLQCCCG